MSNAKLFCHARRPAEHVSLHKFTIMLHIWIKTIFACFSFVWTSYRGTKTCAFILASVVYSGGNGINDSFVSVQLGAPCFEKWWTEKKPSLLQTICFLWGEFCRYGRKYLDVCFLWGEFCRYGRKYLDVCFIWGEFCRYGRKYLDVCFIWGEFCRYGRKYLDVCFIWGEFCRYGRKYLDVSVLFGAISVGMGESTWMCLFYLGWFL